MKDTGGEGGFSLVELMVVVAIVAIMAAIAIPLYMRFAARAQGAEALTLGSGLEPHMVEYYSEHQQWPSQNPANHAIGVAAPASIRGKYVGSVEVRNARIVATFGVQANRKLVGTSLVLSPIVHSGAIEWTCLVSDKAIYAMVPDDCRHSR